MSAQPKVRPDQRHSATRPCRVCGGFDGMRRGEGHRCHGYVGDSGHIFCTDASKAGACPPGGDSGGFRHNEKGPCPCGVEHAAADSTTIKRPKAKPSIPIADIEVRSVVYAALRESLPPIPFSDMGGLRARGLDDDDITRLGYAYLPVNGRDKIAFDLADRFGKSEVLGCPGFTLNNRGEPAISGLAGLLIPVRDALGRIKSQVIRPTAKNLEGPKYLHFTSATKTHNGPSPGAPSHVPLGTDLSATDGVVRLTEGILKADVAAKLSGFPTIGLSGVSAIADVMGELRSLGAKVVRIAFDADFRETKEVALALVRLADRLKSRGFGVELETWDIADGKGIDDLFHGGKRPEILIGRAANEALASIAKSWDIKPEPKGEEPPPTDKPKLKIKRDTGPRFANFYEVKGDDKDGPIRVAYRMGELETRRQGIVGDWPKRVGDTLFWESPDHQPVYFRSSAQLFAWIDRRAQVAWTKGATFITQERFYEDQRMTAERFDRIELLPHWPPMAGAYYMHEPIPEASGKLGELVDHFSPATDEDRELLISMIVTLFWGGEAGSRPAFLITGLDGDQHQGRGIGKSKGPQIIAEELAGGYIDVSPNDDIEAVKTRLLSEGGSRTRVAMIDNIKTLRLSWGELEGLITGPKISGHAMYVGEGNRPNCLTWILTVNGASLSKDMAQRVVVIKLARPVYRADWEATVKGFIRANRLAILAEIRDLILSDGVPIKSPSTRWAPWDEAVLSKMPRAERCQRLIADRRESVDDDNEERDIVATHFRNQFIRCRYKPDEVVMFVRSGLAAQWLSEATRTNHPTNKATSYIKGLGIPELRKTKKNGTPGWEWRGKRSNPGAPMEWLFDPKDAQPDPEREPGEPAF